MSKARAMSILGARTFLLGAYHDLPNVLFIGSLILGSITGYLPLIWMAVGLLFNATGVFLFQLIFKLLIHPDWIKQYFVSAKYSWACDVYGRVSSPRGPTTGMTVPSFWMAGTAFFAVFAIYNSIKLAMRPSAKGVAEEKVDNRKAFSYTTLTVGIAFLLLVLARGFTGCETWQGGILGLAVGGGLALAWYHILDACGTGAIPDLLQAVNSLAPEGSGVETPVVCTPPATMR